ncbi:hypothetical protein ABW20_dc0107152 [Dactylellina cionopaga]|nr:hypothetical protein ABW20_dc0107152 [Dactylellina cionopaga]
MRASSGECERGRVETDSSLAYVAESEMGDDIYEVYQESAQMVEISTNDIDGPEGSTKLDDWDVHPLVRYISSDNSSDHWTVYNCLYSGTSEQ